MAKLSVEIERRDDVAVVRVSRPPANAIVLELAERISDVVDEAARTDVKALVLTGIDGYFSAGVDLKIVPTYDPAEQRAMVSAINRVVRTLYGCPHPVVGAISGHAIAGGLVLALCCDYRLGARGPFKLGLTEGRAGVPFPAAAMTASCAELSPAAARRLILTSQTIDPEEALAWGVLDRLESPSDLLTAALDVARDLGSIPRETYARTKRQLRGPTLAAMDAVIEAGSDPALTSWLSEETPAAAASLLEKKPPK